MHELRIESCRICGSGAVLPVYRKNEYDLARCRSCKTVFVVDPPSTDELSRLYSFDSGYHLGFREDEAREERAGVEARERAELLGRHESPGRLLDIGCSAGHFLSAARDRGWDTVGVELSGDTAELARKWFALEIHTGDIANAPLADESFDAVTMWDVFEHLADPIAKLQRIRRLLRPGGLLLILTPNVEGLFPKLSLLSSPITGEWTHPEPPHHLFQFSKRSLRLVLARHGFQVVEIKDLRIPLRYSFRGERRIVKDLKRLLYAALFLPLAALGPLVRAGDQMIAIARKV